MDGDRNKGMAGSGKSRIVIFTFIEIERMLNADSNYQGTIALNRSRTMQVLAHRC